MENTHQHIVHTKALALHHSMGLGNDSDSNREQMFSSVSFAVALGYSRVVLLQNDGVQVRELVHLQRGRLEQVLLLNFAGLGTLVTKDEVNL